MNKNSFLKNYFENEEQMHKISVKYSILTQELSTTSIKYI